MVERPIKKSERQQSESTEGPAQNVESKLPAPVKGGEKRQEKRSSRGKRSDAEEPKQAVNPALMRGPKPVKPQPVAEPVPEAEPETAEATQDETTES